MTCLGLELHASQRNVDGQFFVLRRWKVLFK